MSVVFLCGVSSACSTLPSSGPTASRIVDGERKEAEQLGFTVIDLTSTTVPSTDQPPLMSPNGLAALARHGQVDLLGPGDVLSITVYEVGVMLFGNNNTTFGSSPGGSFDPSARGQSLSGVTVRDDGTIQLPYIGKLVVSGRTTAEVERMIVLRLRGSSQAPQALVAVLQNVHNTVLVSGSVAKPGRQSLTLAKERLLDVISAAGGVGTGGGPENTVVRVRRDGRVGEAYLAAIESGGIADLVLLPGDRIDVLRRPRTFSVFGAAGRVSQVPFPSASVSLAEAIAQSGGPDDNRADSTAVFVFRDNAPPPDIVDTNKAAPAGAPVVYRINFQKPSNYFLAQRFAMRDKDVIFIANARINQTRKLVELFNILFTPVYTIRATVQ